MTFRECFFKNIFHNFKDFRLFVKPLLKSPSQLLHPKSRIYTLRCPEKPSCKAGVWTWCPIFTFGTGKSLKNCCLMQTSKNPNTATSFDNGWIPLVFTRRGWWWTLHHQHSPPAEKREHQNKSSSSCRSAPGWAQWCRCWGHSGHCAWDRSAINWENPGE